MSQGQEGKPGEPGKPGTRGGGAGGRGGKGGRGGQGGAIGRRRALIVYILLVLVAVGGVALYQVQTTRTLNRHDERSCAQRNRLAKNQRAVIGGLLAVLTIEVDELKDHAGTRASLISIIKDLKAREVYAGPEIC